jgi:hypothetical protein
VADRKMPKFMKVDVLPNSHKNAHFFSKNAPPDFGKVETDDIQFTLSITFG